MDRESLAQAILDLGEGAPAAIPDEDVAHALGQHIKPYVDRLLELRQGTTTADDVSLDDLAVAAGVSEEDSPAATSPDRRRTRGGARGGARGPLPQLAGAEPKERARWIFMDRFITLDQTQEILGYEFDPKDRQRHLDGLNALVDRMLSLPAALPLVESNDIPALQRLFASTVLLMRNPFLGDEEENPVPCNLGNLRQRFPQFFYKRRNTPNWYEAQDFYSQSLSAARWTICETDYLNCTLRSPERKVSGYARRWRLPEDYAFQKTVLEDIYDRVICGRALKENAFEQSCSSCTATTYQPGGQGQTRQVYTVQREQKIAIHGKTGLPHWRATRRLWPGVFPALAIPGA